MGKNSRFPVNKVPQIRELVIRMQSLLNSYHLLGHAFGNKHKAMEIWNSILQKTEKKLTRWKAQYLSLGGRLILINLVLDFSAYLCDVLIPNPNRSGGKMDKLRRNFL